MTVRDENELQREAAEQLRAGGFVVATDVSLPSSKPSKADVVAWVTGRNGRLVSALLVEVKRPAAPSGLEGALSQLATYANTLGTAHAYVFDGTWYRANETFTRLVESPVPRLSAFEGEGSADETHEAFGRALSGLTASLREQGKQADLNELLQHVSAAIGPGGKSGVSLLDDLVHRLPGGTVLEELRLAVERIGAGRRSELAPTPHALSDALAALASPQDGATVEDPFAGFGNCLWSVDAYARARGFSVRLLGREVVPERLQMARTLARIGGIHAELEARDFFDSHDPLAPIVVAEPPIGMRGSQRRPLSFGAETTDTDVAILDAMVHRLPAGGRLVQVIPPKLLFGQGAAKQLRDHLVRTSRVVSIIELPPKVLGWTAIRCAVVVIEKRPSTATLMARLGDDWAQQLAPGGAFLAEYTKMLEGLS
jgi:hypothetical protein